MNIISTNTSYTYLTLKSNLNLLKTLFPFIHIDIVGKSVLGKNLYSIKLGNGSKKVFYLASIHANEWITSLILMKFIEDCCDAYLSNSFLDTVSISELFNKYSIYIMPMANPDGVDLVNDFYLDNSFPIIKAKEIASNFPDIDFPSGWKANINGVNFKIYQPFSQSIVVF